MGVNAPRRGRFAGAGVQWVLAGMAALVIAAVAVIAASVGPLTVNAQPHEPGPPHRIDGPSVPAELTTQAPQDQQVDSAQWLWWIGVGLAGLIGLALVLWLVNSLRTGFGRTARPVVAGTGAPVATGTWTHLSQTPPVDLGDDRRFDVARSADDIIASWETVEAAVAALGLPRRPASTPTEFIREVAASLGDPRIDSATARGSGPHVDDEVLAEAVRAGHRSAADVLLALYHRARFDTGALSPGAASAARRAARLLLDYWAQSRRASRSLPVAPTASAVPARDSDSAGGRR